jgi:hypothetical protein
MTHQWDELSKSLAESVPRRESLRRLGVAIAGAALSPLGLETVWAAGKDPCKAFCRCSSRTQQNACLVACRACNEDTSRLCGSCGSYVCCGSGRTCCSGYCTDLADDALNCGACGFVCDEPGPYEYGACIDGECTYVCAEGAVYCDGTCTLLAWDPHNCGACGNVCGGSNPYCIDGECSACPPGLVLCGDSCVDLAFDRSNCGACGQDCGPGFVCAAGTCCDPLTQYCGVESCGPGEMLCAGTCVNLSNDFFNCGACGRSCEGIGEYCDNGVCNNVFPPSE